MNTPRLMTSLYIQLLRLFPHQYRLRFGEERLHVFRLAVEESSQHGTAALARFGLRELLDLPGSIMYEHLRERRIDMSASLSGEDKPSSWGWAIMGGLPFLLYACMKYLPLLLLNWLGSSIQPGSNRLSAGLKGFPPTWWALQRWAPASYWYPPRVFYQTISWLFTVLVLVMLLVAWRKGWPRWSGSWVGFGLIVLLEMLISFFPGDPESFITTIIWLCLYSAVIFLLARRDVLTGLLGVLPLTPMFLWTLSLDGVNRTYPEEYAYLAAGLLVCIAITLAVRRGSLKLTLGLMAGVLLILGLGISYGLVYRSSSPLPAQPTIGRLLVSTSGNYIGLLIFSTPVWIILLWRYFRRRKAAA